MHIQAIGQIDIPLVMGSKGITEITKEKHIRCFPYSKDSVNQSPYSKLLRLEDSTKTQEFGNKRINTVSNTYSDGISILHGYSDVDLVYTTYLKHPTWFEGSSEEAFKNRESVFNLAFNLLTMDWYSFLKEKASIGILGINEFKLFADALKEVGITRFPEEKPRYPLHVHTRQLAEFYTNELVTNWDTRTIPLYNEKTHGEFDDYVLGDINPLNTKNLIRHCLMYGGIAYLINLLYCLYGSRIISNGSNKPLNLTGFAELT